MLITFLFAAALLLPLQSESEILIRPIQNCLYYFAGQNACRHALLAIPHSQYENFTAI
jgi:hypothetical protein